MDKMSDSGDPKQDQQRELDREREHYSNMTKSIEEILEQFYLETGGETEPEHIKEFKLAEAALEAREAEIVRQALDWWKADITNGFIPKCSQCNRKATEQTTKGKHAQEANHRPVNWGYYCKKHWDVGVELEREAMS